MTSINFPLFLDLIIEKLFIQLMTMHKPKLIKYKKFFYFWGLSIIVLWLILVQFPANSKIDSQYHVLITRSSLPVLKSQGGQDVEAMYSRLENFAQEGDWRKADEQNWALIKQVGNRWGNLGSQIHPEEIAQISCSDLRRIDEVCKKHSNGNFGYSVQLKVWREQFNTTQLQGLMEGERNREVFQASLRLYAALGWLITPSSKRNYQNFIFDLQAPPGHLPCYSGNSVNHCYTACDSGRAPGFCGGVVVENSRFLECRL
ncbi:GUN4 domain-containing protein [Arthrospira platensis]|nr:GUN4 domain protein [Arthrospira platensis C1]